MGLAATPLRHTRNCGKSRGVGVGYTLERDRGGVASAPLRRALKALTVFKSLLSFGSAKTREAQSQTRRCKSASESLTQ